MLSILLGSLFLLPLCSTPLAGEGKEPQELRVYLSNVLEPTTRKNAAFYLQPEGKDGELFIGKIYSMDGKLKAEGRYRDEALTLEEGPFVFYYTTGKVESKGLYASGRKTGVWERYDHMGLSLAEKVYDPQPLENIIYTLAQTMPQYPGGEKALVRTIKERVSDPKGKSVRGKVTAGFIVEKNGELTDVKMIQGQNEQIDRQVVDVIKSTSPWQPGADKGVPVRVQMRIPVQF